MTSVRKKYLLIAAVVYVLAMSALVWGLFALRQNVLREASSAQGRDNWQQWREEVERQQQEPQAVARRVPRSAEPPAMVLMRDYFVTCLVGAVLFVSLLFWALAGMAIGVATTGDRPKNNFLNRGQPRSRGERGENASLG